MDIYNLVSFGGIAALVAERRKDLAAVGPRALLAATLACLMTGAVAGTFFLKRPPPRVGCTGSRRNDRAEGTMPCDTGISMIEDGST
ncbi:MAG TPA: hypothetical protein VMZ50_11890 [Phycisphaerae bacterium]|nr:hypothetical protein [Phycisphaerae bacterium]